MNNHTSQITEQIYVSKTKLVHHTKIVLKTIKHGQIKITDPLLLFSLFEPTAKSTHVLSFKSATIHHIGDVIINSWATDDRINSFHDSS
jgi:hypothetical protein